MTTSPTPEPTETEVDAALAAIADLLDFTPAPSASQRYDGWSPHCQRKFIAALAIMGVVAAAAKAVGLSPQSAYKLRKRPGAEAFAAAWDDALFRGRNRAYEKAVDRAINGYHTPVRYRGQIIGTRHQYDNRMIMHALRDPPLPPVTHAGPGRPGQGRPSPAEMAWANDTFARVMEDLRRQEALEREHGAPAPSGD